MTTMVCMSQTAPRPNLLVVINGERIPADIRYLYRLPAAGVYYILADCELGTFLQLANLAYPTQPYPEIPGTKVPPVKYLDVSQKETRELWYSA